MCPMPMLSSVNVCEKGKCSEAKKCTCMRVVSVSDRERERVGKRAGLQLIAYIYATLCTVSAVTALLLPLSVVTAADYMASLLYGGVCTGISNRAEPTVPHMTRTHTYSYTERADTQTLLNYY